ncbi:MAG: hypothetical protein ACYC6G_08150 [Desulfobaccales bacterium]
MNEANKDMLANIFDSDYDLIVKKRKGLFVVVISELALIAQDKDLNNAYKKIEIEKKKYFKEMIELGLSKSINEPKRRERAKGFGLELIRFTANFVIICLLIGAVGLVGAKYLVTPEFILGKAIGLVRATGQRVETMAPERKLELKKKLHKFIEQVKLFIDEFNISFEDPDRKKVVSSKPRAQE